MSELQQNLDYVTLEVDGSTYKVIALTSGGRGHISAYLRNGYKDASLLRTAKHYSEHFEVIATETPAAPVEGIDWTNPFENGKPSDNYYNVGDVDTYDPTLDGMVATQPAPVEETAQSAYEIDQYYYDTLNEKQFGNQPAQPLAELETLRAENAALKAHVQLLNDVINDRANKYINDTKALLNGMKEKDAAFNALMAERNQLRDALKEALKTLNGLKGKSSISVMNVRILNAIKSINSALESE